MLGHGNPAGAGLKNILRCKYMTRVIVEQGFSIPQIGLGTFDLKELHILEALQLGYRLIDTAWQYGNEREAGRAIKASGLDRGELFVTTKLWTEAIRQKRVRETLEDSLRNLMMEYVDLYLIHWPADGFEQAWLEMEKLKAEGKIRAIGVSNFQPHHIEALRNVSDTFPVINQIERHPFYHNKEVTAYCRKQGMAVQAWCPLGGAHARFFEKEIFRDMGRKYQKSPAQIILRWHIQKGIYVIPRSSHPIRLKDNLEVFDFRLDDADVDLIDALDTGRRIGADPDNFQF